MIIICYLNRGKVSGWGLRVFGIFCVNFRQLPQKCLPNFGIHMMVCPLGISLLHFQKPPIQGVSHLDGRIPQRNKPCLVGIRPWGGMFAASSSSSSPPSANCWYSTRLFATFPILDTGTPLQRRSTSNSFPVSRMTAFSKTFSRRSSGSAASRLAQYSKRH